MDSILRRTLSLCILLVSFWNNFSYAQENVEKVIDCKIYNFSKISGKLCIPFNSEEMLLNIKRGIYGDVFFRKEFYSTKNIKYILGEYDFKLREASSRLIHIDFYDKGIASLSDESYTGMINGEIELLPFEQGGCAFILYGGIRSPDVKFSIETVRTVFGDPNERGAGFSGTPPEHGIYIPPSKGVDEFSNKRLIYKIETKKSKIILSFLTNSNNYISEFEIRGQKK